MPKTCYRCHVEKSLEEFHKRSDRKDGRQNRCKACDYARYLERLAEDPERVRGIGAASQRKHRKRRAYGITNEQYDAMVAERAGRCDICGKVPAKLVVEHCHKTGVVRGLTCSHCNSVLGHAFDDADVLRAAIRYVEATRS